VRLTSSSPSCDECHEIWEPKPPGTLWATPGLLRDSFNLTFYVLNTSQIRLFLSHSVRFNLSLKIPITCFYLCQSRVGTMHVWTSGRLQLKCDGTRWRTGWEVKGKLANGVGSQYSSHYFGTWCIQHYYSWCAQLGCQ